MVAPGWPFGRPGLRPVFFRSDLGAGLASPSDDGGLLEFFEFCFTRAARSATCARSSATRACSSSTCAACASSCAMCASRSASSSRNRALAVRNPAITSSGEAASPGTPGLSGTSRTLPEPALRKQRDTPGRPARARNSPPAINSRGT